VTPAAVGAAALLDATAFAAFWRDAGVGVVVEIRRPLRRHPREAPDAPASE